MKQSMERSPKLSAVSTKSTVASIGLVTNLGEQSMKLVLTPLIILLFALPACAAGKYFPKGTVRSEMMERHYERLLSVMKEPILRPKKGKQEYFAFRVLYLPTWRNAVAIRIEKNGDYVTKRSVRLTGDALSSSPQDLRIAEERERRIDNREFEEFLDNLRESGMMNLPAIDSLQGFDGDDLVVEVIQGDEYSFFVRWSPDLRTKQRNLEGVVEFYTRLFKDAGLWHQGDKTDSPLENNGIKSYQRGYECIDPWA